MFEDATGDERLGVMPMGAGFMVYRGRMIHDLVLKGRRAGIVLISAPEGFGKTAVLLQYVEEVKSDSTRGDVKIIEAAGSIASELFMQLEVVSEQLVDQPHSMIAIDNVPLLDDADTTELIARIRELRDRGVGVLATCSPLNTGLLNGLGDSVKMTAQMLRVHPYEYSDWAKALSISTTSDVYGLTQGVPELVSALQAGRGDSEDAERLLESAVVSVYASLLAELSERKDAFFSLVCMMLLVGEGNMADFERCGMRPAKAGLPRLVRDYPLFGYDASTRNFMCLGSEEDARPRVRELVVHICPPELVMRAVRIQVKAGRCGAAVELAGRYLDHDQELELIGHYVAELVLSGHAAYVHGVVSACESQQEDGESALTPSAALAEYMAACALGNPRAARRMSEFLVGCRDRTEHGIDGRAWRLALALGRALYPGQGKFPGLPPLGVASRETAAGKLLSIHEKAYTGLLGGLASAEVLAEAGNVDARASEIDIPRLLVETDRLLAEALDGTLEHLDDRDDEMHRTLGVLEGRGLQPVAIWVRLTLATRRLLAGRPVTDEQAFCEAGRYAVRSRDTELQLFCMVMEGWQNMMQNQPVNAKFRAVQALKLLDDPLSVLRQSALLLERVAMLRNTSLVTVREEAELLDLGEQKASTVEAWTTAMHLACAGRDTDLSAWMSVNRTGLLEPGFRLYARLGLHCLGENAELIRRRLPPGKIKDYSIPGDELMRGERLFEVVSTPSALEISDQVEICLLGGFRAARDGKPIPEKTWRRRKAAILTARLALGMGSLVSRETLAQELWPQTEYKKARNNLYSTMSLVRRALGNDAGNEPCIIMQSEGICLNPACVRTDIQRFDDIAREVLVKRNGVSGPHLVELCLKIEQLYKGPLYLPSGCNPVYFSRTRRIIESKFLDCMTKGALTALEENDLQSALWLIEAGLRQETTREDLLRAAMRIYDIAGRRRDIVEIYNGHLHYLNAQLGSYPEPETRALYERIVERGMRRSVV